MARQRQPKQNKGPTTPKPGSPTKPPNVRAQERRNEAVRLRAKGLTYREIAATVGYKSEVIAYRAIKSQIEKVNTQAVGEYRQLTMARLEMLLSAHWDLALAGSDKSAKVVLDTIAAMNRMMGAESAAKVEVSGPQGGPVPLSPVLAGMSDEELKGRIEALEQSVRATLAKPVKQA